MVDFKKLLSRPWPPGDRELTSGLEDTSTMGKSYTLGKDAYKRKKFPTVPGGTYTLQITSKTAIKNGKALNIHAKVLKDSKGKKITKNVSLFEYVAFHVDWKVAQVLLAIGKKLTKFTPELLLKLVKGKKARAILRETTFNGKGKNEVVQWLPLKAASADDGESQDDDEDENEAEGGDDDETPEDDDDAEPADDDDEEPADDDDEEPADDDDEEPADDDEEPEDDDEEPEDDESANDPDDEEEEKPRRKPKPKPGKPAKKTARKR